MTLESADGATARIQEVEGDEPDIVIGSREQIFHLLAEAAEIEHTLMCSYLYAAFSLRTGVQDGFSPDEANAVKTWNDTIMSVAIEEMGHLLIVANLTAAVGGRPHFTRPNFPVSDGYFPSGVSLSLSPFSLDTLDHFIFLERPTGSSIADGDGFETESCEREQVHLGLMPTTQDYTTVSHLYEAIRANLVAFAARHGEDILFLGAADSQLGPDIVQFEGVEIIRTLDAAHRAMDLIVEQGEGASLDRSDSHFARFTGIRETYLSLMARNPGFDPAYPVASNPVLRRVVGMAGKTFIEARPAAAVLDLATAVYGLLLRLLVQAYAAKLSAHKADLMETAIALMHILGDCGRLLPRMPAKDDKGERAGMSFTMLRAVEPFVSGDAEAILIRERLNEVEAVTVHLAKHHPELRKSGKLLAGLMSLAAAEVSN